MRRPALAACALLALTACGTSAAHDTPVTSAPDTVTSSDRATPAEAPVIAFGSDHRFASGLVVTVGNPKTFKPSESAYPRADRAAAFGVVVYNETGQTYRISGLAVNATVDDQQTKQLVDPTQGYNGIVDADRDVQPGQIVRFSLAFAVPDRTTAVRLTIRPDSAGSTTAVYGGSV
ncbi:hypothetical protein ABZ863_05570 [Saccharomonospora sp. NPDC046836]|uniref:hypothetical protein n=1 Tax=Saccharomonospora sp. NPDC046836 TaxID=3156921 RepID=UPI0034063BCA